MGTKDKFIKAASKLADKDDSASKSVLLDIQAFGQLTDTLDELYVKGDILRQECLRLRDKWEKVDKAWMKDFDFRRTQINNRIKEAKASKSPNLKLFEDIKGELLQTVNTATLAQKAFDLK